MIEKLSEPGFDIKNLCVEDKIRLVKESDGLLVDILNGETIEGYLDLTDCASLTHLPENLKVSGDLYLLVVLPLPIYRKT